MLQVLQHLGSWYLLDEVLARGGVNAESLSKAVLQNAPDQQCSLIEAQGLRLRNERRILHFKNTTNWGFVGIMFLFSSGELFEFAEAKPDAHMTRLLLHPTDIDYVGKRATVELPSLPKGAALCIGIRYCFSAAMGKQSCTNADL